MKRFSDFLRKHYSLISGSVWFTIMIFFSMVAIVGCQYLPEYYNQGSVVCGFAVGSSLFGFIDALAEHFYSKRSKKDEKNRQTETQ